jgi:hypothetical protein
VRGTKDWRENSGQLEGIRLATRLSHVQLTAVPILVNSLGPPWTASSLVPNLVPNHPIWMNLDVLCACPTSALEKRVYATQTQAHKQYSIIFQRTTTESTQTSESSVFIYIWLSTKYTNSNGSIILSLIHMQQILRGEY